MTNIKDALYYIRLGTHDVYCTRDGDTLTAVFSGETHKLSELTHQVWSLVSEINLAYVEAGYATLPPRNVGAKATQDIKAGTKITVTDDWKLTPWTPDHRHAVNLPFDVVEGERVFIGDVVNWPHCTIKKQATPTIDET